MVDLEVTVPDELPAVAPEQADQLLAMTREALSNIARHSGASRATIELAASDSTIRLVIGDNGRGFDTRQQRTGRQHGLTNLAARAESLGGTLNVTSAPGEGTRMEALVPLEPAGAA